MPPDHGAAAARVIREDAALAASWRLELEEMRLRIAWLRTALARAEPRLDQLARQGGMFAMLPLSRDAVLGLRKHDGIYMAYSGRINIAGLRLETIAPSSPPSVHTFGDKTGKPSPTEADETRPAQCRQGWVRKGMKVIISGAAGLLGHAVRSAFIEGKATVLCIAIGQVGVDVNEPDGSTVPIWPTRLRLR